MVVVVVVVVVTVTAILFKLGLAGAPHSYLADPWLKPLNSHFSRAFPSPSTSDPLLSFPLSSLALLIPLPLPHSSPLAAL